MCLAVARRQAHERDEQQERDNVAIERLLAAELDHCGEAAGRSPWVGACRRRRSTV